METLVVNSWDELQSELFADSWNKDLRRYRSRFAFRGLSDSAYRLETTLIRLDGPYAELERHLLRNFKKYAHRSVVERDSIWHWLSVAQHYGLPTRVLDWTYSPFIAMHFATANIDKFDTEGVIWAVNYVKAHELLPVTLKQRLELEGANVMTVEMLSESINSLEELDNLAPREGCHLLRAPLHRRPHRQSVRLLFDHVGPLHGSGRLAGRQPGYRPQDHHPGVPEVGGP